MQNNDLVILLVLAAVAGFLLLRLRSVLGERTGFEDPDAYKGAPKAASEPERTADEDVVVPMGRHAAADDDSDIFAYAEPDSDLGKGLKSIKEADPEFDVRDFVDGAKGAYEMLLTAFDNGDKETLKPFLAPDVFTAFSEAIDHRRAEGLSVDMRFVGIRTAEPVEARFEHADSRAEVSIRFVAEVITATRNAQGDIVAGDPSAVERISDVWTFARVVTTGDPNWILTATGGD